MKTANKKYYSKNRRNRNSGSRRRKSEGIDPNTLIQNNTGRKYRRFKAKHKFFDLPLHPGLIANLVSLGYEWPTEIQQASLDLLLDRKDLIGVASTGTGKTAAFLIPLIERLLTGNKEFTSLVVVPTRELAIQVTEEFKNLTRHMEFASACFIGGTSVEKDIQKLRKFNHLIIGTPGRLLDMTERNALRMNDISVLVLDEFDRMLDMGFVNDIRKMVRMIGRRDQTMLFSATMDPGQKDIIREIIGTPEVIKVSNGSEPSTNVEQHLVRIREDENKFKVLVDMVNDASFEKVIIFAETKRMVDKLSKKLNRSGIKASHIHGDKSQNYRNRAIRRFREGTSQILVATDVAARGIDIAEVSHVINYQVPRTKDSYVHRIGRTGRAGNTGMAYTFVD